MWIVCSPPGSFVHGISQARMLEWVAISFSRGSSCPRDWTHISCIAGGFFTIWATKGALKDKCLNIFENTDSVGLFLLLSHYSIQTEFSGTLWAFIFSPNWHQVKPLKWSEVGFACGSAGKKSASSAGDVVLIPGLGRSPGKGKGYPLQYSGLENSTDWAFIFFPNWHQVTPLMYTKYV